MPLRLPFYPTLSREAVRELSDCPTCSASIGEPCRGPSKTRLANHAERVKRAAARASITIMEDGVILGESGKFLGRLSPSALTEPAFLLAWGTTGGERAVGGKSDDSDSATATELAPNLVERRETASDDITVGGGGGPNANVLTLDVGVVRQDLRLFQEWVRIFRKNPTRVRYGPSAQRAAKRALEEAPYEVCVQALEGAREYRKTHAGSAGFTDIFGTFRGTGDLASRIDFFAEYAGSAQSDSRKETLLDHVPSAQRPMVRERMRHVEAAALRTEDRASREAGELAEEWLRHAVSIEYRDQRWVRVERTEQQRG